MLFNLGCYKHEHYYPVTKVTEIVPVFLDKNTKEEGKIDLLEILRTFSSIYPYIPSIPGLTQNRIGTMLLLTLLYHICLVLKYDERIKEWIKEKTCKEDLTAGSSTETSTNKNTES